MLKKALYLGAAAALLLALFFGRDAVSYVSTSWNSVKSSVREAIPLDLEIRRAHDMIESLDKPIETNMHAIAEEEIAVERLLAQVEAKKDQLTTARGQIMRLNDDLQSGTAKFVYNDRTYTVSQVKTDLSARFERFRNQESTTHKLEQILAARQKGLDAARAKLEEMLSSKRDLEVKVADLEARQKLVEVHQATSEFHTNLDDSRLSRTKELVSDIQKRIEVAERLVDTRGEYNFEIQLDEPKNEGDISSQITDYFGAGRAEIEALVSRQK